MSVFCAPGALRNRCLQRLFNVHASSALHFGHRTRIPLAGGQDDRTEVDLAITSENCDTLLIEAKLTETGFQSARGGLLARYPAFDETFYPDRLPRNGRHQYLGYQLIRNVLAAQHYGSRFAVLVDARRSDHYQQTFHIFAAVRTAVLRSRLHLYTWQELAVCTSKPLQQFLGSKYGIFAVSDR